MIKYLMFLSLLFLGCNNNCKQECEMYNQCLESDNGTCVTGCEDLCIAEGLCKPYYHGERVECVAVDTVECRRSSLCHQEGKCVAYKSKCVAKEDKDCKASNGCEWDGACHAYNYNCIPTSNADCLNSKGCALFQKCFLSPYSGRCLDIGEMLEELN